jgi:hypothetical protein
MSWDVMIFSRRFDPDEGPPEPLAPLGDGDEVRQRISRSLPAVDWSDPSWGVLDGEGWSIEFNLDEEDPISAMMLHVRGGGDPVAAVAKLCADQGWQALDTVTDHWLDPGNPSREGWSEFQDFRGKVADPVK